MIWRLLDTKELILSSGEVLIISLNFGWNVALLIGPLYFYYSVFKPIANLKNWKQISDEKKYFTWLLQFLYATL